MGILCSPSVPVPGILNAMNAELKTGLVLTLLIALLALGGIFWLPGDYNAMESGRRFAPPGGGAPFGDR
jgi:hypothetical protein